MPTENDLRGQDLNQRYGDVINTEYVECTNAMNARAPSSAWEKLMPGTDLLAQLPPDKHWLEMSQQEWEDVQSCIHCVIARMTKVKHIKLTGATKMLALKRPDLIAACDSQLVGFFDLTEDSEADKAIAVMERLRGIVAQPGNQEALCALRKKLAAHKLFGRPIMLSTTRIFEVLCWMETDEGYQSLWGLLGW